MTLIAVMAPVLVGGMGLGAETGYWYFTQRALQHAADVSAHAAGVRNRAGDTEEEMEAAAVNVAAQAGFTSDNSTLTLEWPPLTGPNAGDTDAVEVVLTRTMPRMFSALFNDEPVVARARAVASVEEGSNACILALAPTTPAALSVTGSADLNLVGCDVASNSMEPNGLSVTGEASLSARCAHSVGGAVTNGNVTLAECDEVHEYAPVTPDPYRLVEEPTLPACNTSVRELGNPNSSTTVTPGSSVVSGMPAYHFCNGLTMKGTVNFQPGLYIISGHDLTAEAGARINGTGVTFYIANPRKIYLAGQARLNLSAPTSGELAGIVFFGSRSATSALTHTVRGSSDSIIQGAVYFPTSRVEYAGASTTASANGCTQVIGYTLTFTGDANLGSNCAALGLPGMQVNRFVALLE